jgi:hypothetical protein
MPVPLGQLRPPRSMVSIDCLFYAASETYKLSSAADCTVEEYMKQHCDALVQELHDHADTLAKQLREELKQAKAEMTEASSTSCETNTGALLFSASHARF